MKTHDTPEKSYDLERLVFFSDGVFAIAITLLVIELRPPEHWDGTLDSLLNAVLARLVFYIVSFFSLGMFWMAHRSIFRYVKTFNEASAILNLVFLCLICVMPFVNALTAQYGLSTVVFELYLGEMVAVAVAAGILWFYIAFIGKLVDSRITTGFRWYNLIRLTLTPLILGGASLWIGHRFGIWPSMAFIVFAFMATNKLHFAPFKEEAPVPKV